MTSLQSLWGAELGDVAGPDMVWDTEWGIKSLSWEERDLGELHSRAVAQFRASGDRRHTARQPQRGSQVSTDRACKL